MAKEIFPHRVDLLHGCNYQGFVGNSLLLTPKLCYSLGVKGFSFWIYLFDQFTNKQTQTGFTKRIVYGWLKDDFFPAIEKIGRRDSLLIFDLAPVHSENEIQDLFQDCCPKAFGDVIT